MSPCRRRLLRPWQRSHSSLLSCKHEYLFKGVCNRKSFSNGPFWMAPLPPQERPFSNNVSIVSGSWRWRPPRPRLPPQRLFSPVWRRSLTAASDRQLPVPLCSAHPSFDLLIGDKHDDIPGAQPQERRHEPEGGVERMSGTSEAWHSVTLRVFTLCRRPWDLLVSAWREHS